MHKWLPRQIHRLKEHRAFGKALSISIANQVVSSGTNFVIVLFLVRVLEKEQFGLYSLGFAIMLLVAGLISSSIAVQYVVNLPDQPPEQRADYALHHANAVMLLGLGIAIVVVLLGIVAYLLLKANNYLWPMAAMLLAAVLFSCRDFMVRVAYSAKREDYVLYSSLMVTLVMFSILPGIYYFLPSNLKAANALLVIAGAQFASMALLQYLLRLPFAHSSLVGVKMAFQHSWHGGKWNLLTNIVYNLRTQAHNLIVAPLLGLAAVAEINAARVLVTPAVMVIPPLSQIILPRLAAQRQQSGQALQRFALLTVTGMVAFAIGYSLLMLPWLDQLVNMALGAEYHDAGKLVLAWCFVTVCLALRNGLTLTLQALRDFKGLMLVNTLAAIAAVLMALGFSLWLAAVGAIMALAMAELLLSLTLFALVKRHLR